jgi:membrane protease YdiL (CAAX protease family)
VAGVELLVFYGIAFGGIGYTCLLASKKYGTGNFATDYGWRFAWRDLLRAPLLYIITFALQIPVVAVLRLSSAQRSSIYGRLHALGPGAIAVFALSAIVAAPVFEELVFRGLLQRSLTSRFGIRWAIAIQSVCFGVYHVVPRLGLSNIAFIAPRIVFGVVAGAAADRYRRLGPGVATHALTNTIAVLIIISM